MQVATSRLPALTGLRFVAAFGVLLYHYQSLIAYPSILRDLVPHGGLGVTCFFVLSGFILTYTYSTRFMAGLTSADLRSYAVARFARIVPLYLFALLLSTPVVLWALVAYPGALAPPSEMTTGFLALSWLANLCLIQTYIPNAAVYGLWNSPAWSVSAEAVFYLCFPFLMWAIMRRVRRIPSLLALIAGCVLAQVLCIIGVALILRMVDPAWELPLLRSPLRGFWDFCIGCIAGLLFVTRPIGPSVRMTLASASVIGLGVLLLLPDRISAYASLLTQIIDCSGLLFVALILALASGAPLLTPLLAHPWMVALGEASYALYLLHWTPLTILSVRAQSGQTLPPGLAPVVMLATIPASIAVYHYLEVPARRWLRRRAGRFSRSTLSTASSST